MSNAPDELKELLIELIDGGLSPQQAQRLDDLLSNDPAAQDFYEGFLTLHSMLRWQHTPLLPGLENAVDQLHGKSIEACSCGDDSPRPILGFLGEITHGAVGSFSSGWPVAYLMATVILAIGLLIGSFVPVFSPVQLANPSLPTKRESAFEPKMEMVARVTGVVDCQWAEPSTATVSGAHVPLGRKYALSSGLMEITYDTGAKVILQGPVTYEVESPNGGFMSVGKLTGKMEVEIAKGFFVRTPTATVIDLGTEFALEVKDSGNCDLQVFAGTVKMQQTSAGGTDIAQEIQVGAGQSVQIDAVTKAVSHEVAEPARFVRNINSYLASRIISVNFTCAGKVSLDPEERTGVLTTPNWNNVDASVNPVLATELRDAAGIASGATVSWQWTGNPTTPVGCNYEYAESRRTAREKLISGRFDGHAGDAPTLTLSVTNIPFAKYKTYVYYWLVPSPGEGRNQSFGLSVNGCSPIVIARPLYDLGGFCRYRSPEQPSDYQVFEGLSGDLIVKTTRDGKGPYFTQPIVGLQIVETTAGSK